MVERYWREREGGRGERELGDWRGMTFMIVREEQLGMERDR